MTTGGAYLGRQPILENGSSIFGYEFFFRGKADATTADFDDDLAACTRVMQNIMTEMGTQWLFGDRFAFINVSSRAIHSDFIALLPADKVVLELVDGLIDGDVARIKELKAQGFRFCVDLPEVKTHPEELIFELVDFVKCDARAMEGDDLAKRVSSLQNRGITCIADKVETESHKSLADSYGFTYFQGYFFARPETLTTKTVPPSNAIIMDLLGRVSRGDEVKAIEEGFKRDVTMSFRLLKYINSAGFGVSCEIQSIRHALTVLGYQQLYRWLTLLLVTSANHDSNAICQTALTRGRLCELLGDNLLSGRERENLFIVGVFSLMDVLMGMPMEKIMESIVIPADVRDSILGEGGVYDPFLNLAKACEANEADKVCELAHTLAMTPEFINTCHIESIAWAESIIA